jgi:hypothetical protein
MENSKRDENYITTLLGVDMTTGLLPTKVYVDETTHRLLVSAVITSMPDVVVTGVATEATMLKLVKVQFTDDVSIAKTVLGDVTTFVKSGTTNNVSFNTQTIIIDNGANTITKTWSLV